MRGKCLTAVVAALILGTGAAWAENFGAPPGRYFRYEWQVERGTGGSPRLTGYVHNDSGMWAARVQLLVEALDASGRPVSKTRDYVSDLPPEGRASFDVTVPAGGATYRVRVETVDWLRGPSG